MVGQIGRRVVRKSEREVQAMREAAKINVEVLRTVHDAIKPGVSTGELNKIAYDIIDKRGATPAFLGYPPGSRHPFPATLTVCINEELVHGIPGKRVLKDGDLVTIDCGTVFKGYVADSAFSRGVGEVSAQAERLIRVTEETLSKGITACQVGNRLGDVSYAIQAHAEANDYNVVREYGGHGVGRRMHEDPHIPNWGTPGKGLRLQPGMTLALEPMVMAGDPDVETLEDNWTVVTSDGALCAHCEHTVHITPDGPEILTLWD
jgi:methionyl aminopeptidase